MGYDLGALLGTVFAVLGLGRITTEWHNLNDLNLVKALLKLKCVFGNDLLRVYKSFLLLSSPFKDKQERYSNRKVWSS